jgi:FKBP-type peptidyl-prolyl cis-trans isomerase
VSAGQTGIRRLLGPESRVLNVLLGLSLGLAPGCSEGPKGAAAFSGEPTSTFESDRGVKIERFTDGEGPEAKPDDWIRVHYRVLLASTERVVDSSHDRKPLVFQLDHDTNLVAGFHEGIRGMREGELRRAHVPAHLAYGDRRIGPIPAKSALIFELELMEPPKAAP